MEVYNLLIIFIIFVLIHKIIALTILLSISVVKLRYVFNILEPIFIIYFLTFFNLNNYIKTLLLLFLLAPINYWLCDKGIIYSIIDNNPQNNKIVKNISFYGDLAINICVVSYVIFFIKNIIW